MSTLTNRLHILTIIAIFTLAWSIHSTRGLAAPSDAPALTPLGNAFTYEGRIPATLSGAYDFKFRLFNAASNGALVTTTVARAERVAVQNGEYIAAVNFGTATTAAFTGEARYLEVRYRKHSTDPAAPYTMLSGPRPQLLPVPYAIGLRPGATVSGAISDPGAIIRGINSGTGTGIAGESASGPGVWGASESWYGVYGESTNESGVRGKSTWGAGAVGLSQYWNGVYGESTGGTGVWGATKTARQGIYGTNAGSGDSYGVIGQVTSFPGAGVLGQNGGSGSGIAGRSASGPGVYGESASGYAMVSSGNTQQARDKGGWVKAMVHIQVDATNGPRVVRCFNSQLPAPSATTVPCGITIDHVTTGVNNVGFGFRVRDRFAIVSPEFHGAVAATVDDSWGGTLPETQLHITTFHPNDKDVSLVDTNFTVIVY